MGLILGIIGTSISFLLFVLEKKEAKGRRTFFILAGIGSLTFLGQQFIDHLSSETSNKVITDIKNKTELIAVTTEGIQEDVSLIQHLLAGIEKQSVDKLGIRINTISELNNLHAFDKGSPEAWLHYESWLMENSEEKTALTVYLDERHHYNSSLLLLYLITNEENRYKVEEIIGDYRKWYNFPENTDLSEVYNSDPGCDFLLILSKEGEVVAFAESRAFISDLLLLFDTDKTSDLEGVLREDLDLFLNFTYRYMTSVKASAPGKVPTEIARNMLEKNLNESVSSVEGSPYYFQLSSMIRAEGTNN